MTYCSVKWCGKSTKNSSLTKNGITFYRFPKNAERKKLWIDATHRDDDNWWPKKFSLICSRHFTEECFYDTNKHRRLLDSAVPTLYLPIVAPKPPEALQEVPNTSSTQGITSDSPLLISTNAITDDNIKVGKNRVITPIAETPSAYDSLIEKRMCMRIIELKNIIKAKNKALKKVRDSNRWMKNKILKLQTMLEKLEERNDFSKEDSIGANCRELNIRK